MQYFIIQEKEQVIEVAVWVRQMWTDYQLQWYPEDYNGIQQINVRPDNLWLPDIVLYNNVNDDNAEFGGNIDTLKTRVVVDYRGNMLWMAPLIIKVSFTLIKSKHHLMSPCGYKYFLS